MVTRKSSQCMTLFDVTLQSPLTKAKFRNTLRQRDWLNEVLLFNTYNAIRQHMKKTLIIRVKIVLIITSQQSGQMSIIVGPVISQKKPNNLTMEDHSRNSSNDSVCSQEEHRYKIQIQKEIPINYIFALKVPSWVQIFLFHSYILLSASK